MKETLFCIFFVLLATTIKDIRGQWNAETCADVVYQMEGTKITSVNTVEATNALSCAQLCYKTASCIRYKFADITPASCDLFSDVKSIRIPQSIWFYGTPGTSDSYPVKGAVGGTTIATKGPYFYTYECDELCGDTAGCVAFVYKAPNLWTKGELRGSCTLYSQAPTPTLWFVSTGPASCGKV